MQRQKIFKDSDSEDEAQEIGFGAEVDEEENDGTEVAKDDCLLIESDSDDAPENVGFVRSRESALQQVKEAMQQIGKTKQQKKEKRRHLDEKFKEQKKKKLERLRQSRLPDNILDDIASRPGLTITTIPEEMRKKPPTENESLASEESGKEHESDDEDSISVNKDPGIRAVCFRDVLKLKEDYVKKVASFREQHLYGCQIARQPVKEKMMQRAKKRASKQRPAQMNKHRA